MRSIDRQRARHATGLVLLAGMFACGGKAGSGSADSDPVSAVPRAVPAAPAPASTPALAPSPGPPQVPAAEPPGSRDGIPYSRALAIENVLDANCGPCHGPRAPGVGFGGINFINDVERLVEAGLIIPLNSGASRIVIAMRDGSMPPPGSGLPLVTYSEIDTVADFIDNPRFWPEFSPSADADGG